MEGGGEGQVISCDVISRGHVGDDSAITKFEFGRTIARSEWNVASLDDMATRGDS